MDREPSGLQSIGLQRIGHNRAIEHTHTHTHTDFKTSSLILEKPCKLLWFFPLGMWVPLGLQFSTMSFSVF